MSEKKPALTDGAAGLFLLLFGVVLMIASLPTLSGTVYPEWLPAAQIKIGLGLVGLILFLFSFVFFIRAGKKK